MMEVPIVKPQSTDLQSKSMNWFLYDRDPCYERIDQNEDLIHSLPTSPPRMLENIERKQKHYGFRKNFTLHPNSFVLLVLQLA